jgi:hypothetical protein
MTQKSKTLPTAEIINKFTTYNAEMNAAMNKGDFNLANEYIEKMEALCEEYDLFDQEFTENGLTGLKDITGQVRIPALYKAIGARYRYDHWRELPVPVMNGEDKYAIVNADGSGKPICDFIYDYITFCPWTDHFIAHRGSKATILRPDGTELLPTMVDTIYEPFNHIVMLENEGKYGLCTTSGDYVAPIYDEMEPDDGDNVHVRLGDTWGYISGDGEFLPEPLSEEDQDKWWYHFRPDFD